MAEEQSLFTAEEFKKNFKKNPNAKREKKEERVQMQVCRYLKAQYPDVIWTCDLASGLWLPPQVTNVHKLMRSSRGLPDLFIARACVSTEIEDTVVQTLSDGRKVINPGGPRIKVYNGLFIELKSEGTRNKNGDIPETVTKIKKKGVVVGEFNHVAEQKVILKRLELQGYMAVFACGFEEAKKVIDNYLR